MLTDFIIYYLLLICLMLSCVGILGCCRTRYNVLILLICIEFIFLGFNFAFILLAFYLDDIVGFFFFIYILSLAGAEAALGLSFVILFYRLRGLLNLRYLTLLKG